MMGRRENARTVRLSSRRSLREGEQLQQVYKQVVIVFQGKPIAIWGRKATGLTLVGDQIAGLPQ